MAELYDVTRSLSITPIVTSIDDAQEVTRVVSKSLSGQTYIQVIGNPVKSYTVTCAVTTTGKEALRIAEAQCDMLRVTVSRGTYYGYVLGLQVGQRIPSDDDTVDYYAAQISLSSEDVS